MTEEKNFEEITEKIADRIAQAIKEAKAKEEDIEKKKAIAGIKMTDYDVKIATTKKGRAIKMKKSAMEYAHKWFKALLNRDSYGMEKIKREMDTKFEPLVEGTATEGGNLVPTLLYDVLIPLIEDAAVIRSRANVIDMTAMKTNTLNISGIASKPIVSWGGENVDKATSSMSFNQISLTPYKLSAIVALSTELRDDSPFNVVSIVSKALAEATAKAEDKAFAVGTGSGQPTGFSTYTPAYTISAGGALSFDHINSCFWGMPQGYRQNAVWLANGRLIAAISSLKDTQGRPLLLESGIITEPGIPAIKGRPVLEQNDLPSSTLYLCDLSQYWIAVKKDLEISMADQAYVAGVSLWQRNLLAVRCESRVDGELVTSRALATVTNTGVS